MTTPHIEDLPKLYVEMAQKLAKLEELLQSPPRLERMTLDQVCELTGLSKTTIYKHTAQGTIPHHSTGHKIVFIRSEIENWIKTRK